MPPSRSSNTLGSAKVVDWKTMLDTAVVRNTIMRDAQQQRLDVGRAPARRWRAGAWTRDWLLDLRPHQDRVGDADQDRDDARQNEGHAPAAVVDEIARDQRRAGDARGCPTRR
jgi:hypothetical protein